MSGEKVPVVHRLMGFTAALDGGCQSTCACGWWSPWCETENKARAEHRAHALQPLDPAPVVTARWSDEVVEAAAEAIHVGWHDNYLDKHPWASLTDYQRGEFRLMARAALGVIPPDPVVAAIRAEVERVLAQPTLYGVGEVLAYRDGQNDVARRIARLLADGSGT